MASYFNPEEIAHYWRTTAATAKALGDDEAKCQIDPPATEDAVRAVEQELGAPIPASFRRVLLTFSRSVELCWFLPEEFELPDEFEEIFCGQISWNG